MVIHLKFLEKERQKYNFEPFLLDFGLFSGINHKYYDLVFLMSAISLKTFSASGVKENLRKPAKNFSSFVPRLTAILYNFRRYAIVPSQV